MAQEDGPESVLRLPGRPQRWSKSWLASSGSETAPGERVSGDALAAPAFPPLAKPAGLPGASGTGCSIPLPALELLWDRRGPRGPSQLLRSTGLRQGPGQSCGLSPVCFVRIGTAVIYEKTRDWKSVRIRQNIRHYAIDFKCSKI